MKKRHLIFALWLAVQPLAIGAYGTYPDFAGREKPIMPNMATRKEMAAYKNEVDTYVADIDGEIEKLYAKRQQAIRDYNQTVREYNKDDFFHTDRLPLYRSKTYDYDTARRPTRRDYTLSLLDSIVENHYNSRIKEKELELAIEKEKHKEKSPMDKWLENMLK